MLEHAILAHSVRCAPAESCGLVIASADGPQYVPCINRSTTPNHFDILTNDYLNALALGEVVAVVHSHPDGMPYLSEGDRARQVASALPWWLVHDGIITRYRCVPPLLGRHFEHGVMDCYSLFRDAYHLAGIEMPDFTRADDWWRHGENLYLDNMRETGLYPVKGDAQPGDIILMCYGCSVANHAAIYLGDQRILHHLPNQLSKREEYNGSWQRRTHSIWRHRDWQPSSFTAICNDLAAASPYTLTTPPKAYMPC